MGWELYREEARKSEWHENDAELFGKRYAVSNRIKDEPDVLEKVIDYIKANSYYLVFSMKNCDYLIAFDESNRDEIVSTSKRERTFKIVTVDELFS